MIDLRLGRWEDVLDGVVVDTLISDPPYDDTTHAGAKHHGRSDGSVSEAISYDHWTPRDVRRFVDAWHERVRGWMVCLTSSGLTLSWQAAYRRVGRYSFAPVPCVIRGMTVRLGGDGPSSWAVYAMVARPRNEEFVAWGTLPGAYVVPRSVAAENGRGKPPWLMQALVRDYTRPGDVVCDPCAGYATTLTAAVGLGRRAVGAEVDPAVYERARAELAAPVQIDLFG